MLARTFCVFRIGIVVASACVFFIVLTSCDEATSATDPQEYSLEVVNATPSRVRIHLAMARSYLLVGSHMFPAFASDSSRTSFGKPYILELDVDERMTVKVIMDVSTEAKDSAEDSVYVRELGAVSFFAAEASTAYRGYAYLGFGCGVELAVCEEADDDSLVYHRSAGGTLERLFVESPDRPFYLERDDRNRDLARLVITFVPTPPEPPDSE